MRYISLFLYAIISLACHQPAFQIRSYNENGYTLVDTVRHGEERVIPFDGYARYGICYIGPDTGEIPVGRPLPRFLRSADTVAGYLARKFDSSYMTLRVDTSATQLQFEYTHFDSVDNRRVVDSISLYKGMRLTLKNVSDSLLYLGSSNLLEYAWLEIQDGKKDWIRMENPSAWYVYCATGLRSNYLKTGEILIAKFPRYEGDYTANFRIAWHRTGKHKIVSNEFVAPVSELMLNMVDLQSDRRPE